MTGQQPLGLWPQTRLQEIIEGMWGGSFAGGGGGGKRTQPTLADSFIPQGWLSTLPAGPGCDLAYFILTGGSASVSLKRVTVPADGW